MAQTATEELAPIKPEILKPSHSRKLVRRGPAGSKAELKGDEGASSTSDNRTGTNEGDSPAAIANSDINKHNFVSDGKENVENFDKVDLATAADQQQEKLKTSPLDSEVTEPETGPIDETELKLEKEADEFETQTLARVEGGDDTGHVHIWPAPIKEDEESLPSLDSVGPEVEEWVRTNKRVSVRAVTWNLCARAPPPIDATSVLLPKNRYHLYVIGTEECERSIAQSAINPSKKIWEAYLTKALGDNYVPLKAHTLQAIHLIVFAHKAIAHLCSSMTSGAVPTGIGNTLGNKGGGIPSDRKD